MGVGFGAVVAAGAGEGGIVFDGLGKTADSVIMLSETLSSCGVTREGSLVSAGEGVSCSAGVCVTIGVGIMSLVSVLPEHEQSTPHNRSIRMLR